MSSKKDSMKTNFALVEVHGKKLITTSLVIAELFGRPHDRVVRSLKRLSNSKKISPLAAVSFTYFDSQNRPQTAYELSERDFLIAMPFIGGTKAEDGQIALVDAFLKYRNRINEPGRSEALQLKRDSHKLMMDVKQVVLEKEGLPVTNTEFIKENMFCNRALTGKWQSIPEPEYGTYDAVLMARIRDFNTYLLVKHGKKQEARKQAISDFVDDYRSKNPKYDRIEDIKGVYLFAHT